MIHIRHQRLHTLQLSATPLRKAKYPKLIKCYLIISGCWLRLEKASFSLRAATDESQKTLNKCETRNKTVFHTRLCHPETINSVPLNSVLRIKQIGV